MITGKAKKAAVIGCPVSHSLSPLMHHYWLDQLKLDGAYVPLEVKREDLRAVLKALPKMGFAGCNLTIPHKEKALKMVDEVSDVAKRIGAINTIEIKKDGSLYGTNTDAYGFMANIKQAVKNLKSYKKKALVLGAGGAAKAICVALQDEGFAEILVANRTKSKASKLAKDLGKPIKAIAWDDIEGELLTVTFLVNTTSLGMKGQPALKLNLTSLPKDALVTDIVYHPLMTSLLTKAKARGNVVVTGLGMLMHQGVPGFKLWFGKTPTVDKKLENYLLKHA